MSDIEERVTRLEIACRELADIGAQEARAKSYLCQLTQAGFELTAILADIIEKQPGFKLDESQQTRREKSERKIQDIIARMTRDGVPL